jgi:hypothetical protein
LRQDGDNEKSDYDPALNFGHSNGPLDDPDAAKSRRPEGKSRSATHLGGISYQASVAESFNLADHPQLPGMRLFTPVALR